MGIEISQNHGEFAQVRNRLPALHTDDIEFYSELTVTRDEFTQCSAQPKFQLKIIMFCTNFKRIKKLSSNSIASHAKPSFHCTASQDTLNQCSGAKVRPLLSRNEF